MNYYFYLLCLWRWGSVHVEVIGHLWIWVLPFTLFVTRALLFNTVYARLTATSPCLVCMSHLPVGALGWQMLRLPQLHLNVSSGDPHSGNQAIRLVWQLFNSLSHLPRIPSPPPRYLYKTVSSTSVNKSNKNIFPITFPFLIRWWLLLVLSPYRVLVTATD